MSKKPLAQPLFSDFPLDPCRKKPKIHILYSFLSILRVTAAPPAVFVLRTAFRSGKSCKNRRIFQYGLSFCRAGTYNNDMPYNFTHALVGLTALKQSNPEVVALVDAHRNVFLIGTMGPDPYFGDAMPRPLFHPCREDLADKLHKCDMRALFSAMVPLAKGSDLLTAYTLGFLCHFLLDTTAHPYIEARFSGKAHTPSEIQMDLMMADRAGRKDIPRSPRIFYRTKDLTALDAFHAALTRSLHFTEGPEAAESAGVFARSFRKWTAVNTLSYDPKNRKLRFFGALERLIHKEGAVTGYLVSHHPDPDDRLNLAHAAWRAPWDESAPRTESFCDLFGRAVQDAPPVLGAALAAIRSGNPEDALAAIGPRRMDARPV